MADKRPYLAPAVSDEDRHLMKLLLNDGFTPYQVGLKFELAETDVILLVVMESPFYIKPRLVENRIKRGSMQLSEDGDLEKQCPHCHEFLPVVEDFWAFNRRNADMMHSMCKCCEQERKAAYREALGMKRYRVGERA